MGVDCNIHLRPLTDTVAGTVQTRLRTLIYAPTSNKDVLLRMESYHCVLVPVLWATPN